VKRGIYLIPFLLSLLFILFSCSSTDKSRKEAFEKEADIRREIKLGKAIALKIVHQYPLLNDPKATEYINKVGKSVALFAGRSDFEYYFGILDTDSINAYAAPGGYVFITKGALALMENEAHLAVVLAHEIAHINLQHIIKYMPPPRDTSSVVDSIAAVLSAQGTMVSAAMNQVAEQAVKVLFEEGYKKEDERMADINALSYAAATGYSAHALPNFIKRIDSVMGEQDGKKAYNTHPSPDERISYLNTAIMTQGFAEQRPDARARFLKYISHLKKPKS